MSERAIGTNCTNNDYQHNGTPKISPQLAMLTPKAQTINFFFVRCFSVTLHIGIETDLAKPMIPTWNFTVNDFGYSAHLREDTPTQQYVGQP